MKYIREYNDRWHNDDKSKHLNEIEYISDLFLEYADAWGIKEVDNIYYYEYKIIADELEESIYSVRISTDNIGISYELNIAFKKDFTLKGELYFLQELPQDFESDISQFRKRLHSLGYFTEESWGGVGQLYRITIIGSAKSSQ